MKNLVLFIALIAGVASYAFEVQTIIAEELQIEGKKRGYKMLHLVYGGEDGKTFLTYGESAVGIKGETIEISFYKNQDRFSAKEQEQFVSSSEFAQSKNQPIDVYAAEQKLSFNELEIINREDELQINLESEFGGDYKIMVQSINGEFLNYYTTVQLKEGENRFLVPVILEKSKIRGHYKILIFNSETGFRGTISNI